MHGAKEEVGVRSVVGGWEGGIDLVNAYTYFVSS